MAVRPSVIALAGVLALSACGPEGAPQQPKRDAAREPEPRTVDIPQTVTEVAPGTTPMAEREAVLGLLNKRNGISRDLRLRPGQAVRVDDVIVRLRACETTAPWEVQQLTGAFVQVDVADRQDRFRRVFSGWLFAESPSLNVVEHPIYDVWPKSCAMTHPDGTSPPEAAERSASSRSSAPKSAPADGSAAAGSATAPDNAER